MGKRGGRTTTKQQAENINAVTMETEDPPTETYTNVMTTYLWHGIKAFQRAPQYHAPGLTFPTVPFNNALFGMDQLVFNVGIGIQMFNSPIRTHDGIRIYIRVVNTLGPTTRIQKWFHEQANKERYTTRTKGRI
jgi:hypothetical protein